MPALEPVDADEDGKQVHVGRVELEVHIRWAEVVAGRHDSNHEEGQTHCVEETEGCTGSPLFHFPLLPQVRKLAPQLVNSGPEAVCGWLHIQPLQLPPQNHVLLHEGDEEEKNAKEHVAHITQDVIPHCEA